VAYGKLLPNLKESFQIVITFTLTVIGFVIFRSETIGDAGQYLMQMFNSSLFDVAGSLEYLKGKHLVFNSVVIAMMVVFEWIQRNKQHALQLSGNGVLGRSSILRFILYFLLVMMIVIFAEKQSEFIYFQF
jgi:D-alanyl-lipoteichoic acid acyltransferase DltB (MBOAT superfamily)